MKDLEREQPVVEPTDSLNKENDESVVSETGSQKTDLGKFKNVEALLDAYNNLQSEFTKKCQLLSSLEKDKTEQEKGNKDKTNDNDFQKQNQDVSLTENEKELDETELASFLLNNSEAKTFVDEIKNNFSTKNAQSPYQLAWANVVLSHLKNNDNKKDDPIINRYVLSDENVKNKIIENYLVELQNRKAPVVISSQGGERLSGVLPDNPKTLEEAKELTNKMFS